MAKTNAEPKKKIVTLVIEIEYEVDEQNCLSSVLSNIDDIYTLERESGLNHSVTSSIFIGGEEFGEKEI